MMRTFVLTACVLVGFASVGFAQDSGEKKPAYPSFDYPAARSHEIERYHHNIPHEGVTPGFGQLHISLIVSPGGEVTDARAHGDERSLHFWPDIEAEVSQWKFKPFLKDGVATTAEVDEYVSFVPPERIPKVHVPPPEVRADSRVEITLKRSGCYGSCPSYSVAITTDGIVFHGNTFLVAPGSHTDKIDPDVVRKLAKRFIDSDFYSMDAVYAASVTDNPTYSLTVSIDGHSKDVVDYRGELQGMPGVITDLEEKVDSLAGSSRWIEGTDGLVPLLQAENFNFKTFAAQTMAKAAALRGQKATVSELLAAGVPVTPLPRPREKTVGVMGAPADVGWLTAGSVDPEILEMFIRANASARDQTDKDAALNAAAASGSLVAVRALIAYGANPNVDVSTLPVSRTSDNMRLRGPESGSILIAASLSKDPEVVREILLHHVDVEAKDRDGRTAMFAAGAFASKDREGNIVATVRVLAQAGGNVKARDRTGNTPLHTIFITSVDEELLKLGADVNARNDDGETPIFTTYDDDAIPLFVEHGADLTIRNKKGETVMEAAANKGPLRQEALRRAMEQMRQRQ